MANSVIFSVFFFPRKQDLTFHVCMKYQNLITRKNKKYFSILSADNFTQHAQLTVLRDNRKYNCNEAVMCYNFQNNSNAYMLGKNFSRQFEIFFKFFPIKQDLKFA